MRLEVENAGVPIASTVIISDNHWKSSATKAAGWELADYNDSAWQPAAQIAPYEAGPWATF